MPSTISVELAAACAIWLVISTIFLPSSALPVKVNQVAFMVCWYLTYSELDWAISSNLPLIAPNAFWKPLLIRLAVNVAPKIPFKREVFVSVSLTSLPKRLKLSFKRPISVLERWLCSISSLSLLAAFLVWARLVAVSSKRCFCLRYSSLVFPAWVAIRSSISFWVSYCLFRLAIEPLYCLSCSCLASSSLPSAFKRLT